MSKPRSAKLERLLSERDPQKLSIKGDFVDAAVMMILKEESGDTSMLFIKRPDSQGDPFSGHVAFPGGKMKSDDSSKLDTAVRETIEEIGVDVNQSGRIIGELDDVNPNNPRASTYIVTPYLSVLEQEISIIPDRREVETVLWVPVRHLLNEKNFKIRQRERGGKLVEDYAYSFEQYIIWGMTGRILHRFFTLTGHLF